MQVNSASWAFTKGCRGSALCTPRFSFLCHLCVICHSCMRIHWRMGLDPSSLETDHAYFPVGG